MLMLVLRGDADLLHSIEAGFINKERIGCEENGC